MLIRGPKSYAFTCAVLYSIFGVLWIFFSDSILLYLVADKETLSLLQTVKGWFFVLISAYALFHVSLRLGLLLGKAESNREQVELLYRSSLEESGAHLLITTAEPVQKTVYVSASAPSLFGVQASDIYKNPVTLFSRFSEESIDKMFTSQPQPQGKNRVILHTLNGLTFHCTTVSSETLVIYSFVQKHQHETKEHPADKLSMAMCSITSEMVIAHKDGIVLLATPAAERFFGYVPGTMKGSELKTVVKDPTQLLAFSFKGFTAYQIFHRNDSAPMICDITTEQTEDGALVTHLRDVSDLFTAEQKLNTVRHIANTRERDIAELLQLLSTDIRHHLNSIHDLKVKQDEVRSSVGKILDSVRLPSELQGKVHSVLKEDLPSFSNLISASVSSMDALLTSITKILKVEITPFRCEQLNPAPIVQDIIESNEYKLAETGGAIRLGTLPDCHADKVMLRTAFQHIIDNALRYTRPNTSPVITVTGAVNGNFSEYRITDNGTGIPEEYHEMVFTLFTRILNTDPGSGIGLTLTRKIIEHHGGSVHIETPPNGFGTTVVISIPQHCCFCM